MAADGEGKSRNHNNDEEIKESVHTGPGFQSAASLLRPHGGAGTGEISLLSPRFRSAAAMAGWDEEALLAASLVVEDTPVRELKGKKRADRLKSPPTTNSQRKRRSRRQNTPPIPPVTLSLDEEDTTGDVARVSSEGKRDTGATSNILEKVKDRGGGSDPTVNTTAVSAAIPCLDRLREELSCAICLDICFEPSTTPCGHSFCKKCLKCAATKCGRRCPKCRELISNARSCTVNTVLWNTIQLLFPMEVEARKKAAMLPGTSKGFAPDCSPENGSSNSGNGKREMNRTRSTARVAARMMERDRAMMRRMAAPTQSEDAALALRLQREEFMEVFRETQQPQSGTVYLARASLRAMASRAIQQHSRRRS